MLLKHFDRFDRNTFDEAQFWLFFSTETKCFSSIFLCAYIYIDQNTFALVELYKDLTETLLIKHSSGYFFLLKQSVSVAFFYVHI